MQNEPNTTATNSDKVDLAALPADALVVGQATAAAALGISPTALRNLVARGELRHHVLPGYGKTHMYCAEDLAQVAGILGHTLAAVPADQVLTPGEATGEDGQAAPPPYDAAAQAETPMRAGAAPGGHRPAPTPAPASLALVELTAQGERLAGLGNFEDILAHVAAYPGTYDVRRQDGRGGLVSVVRFRTVAPGDIGQAPAGLAYPPAALAPAPPQNDDLRDIMKLLLSAQVQNSQAAIANADPDRAIERALDLLERGREQAGGGGGGDGETNAWDFAVSLLDVVGKLLGGGGLNLGNLLNAEHDGSTARSGADTQPGLAEQLAAGGNGQRP